MSKLFEIKFCKNYILYTIHCNAWNPFTPLVEEKGPLMLQLWEFLWVYLSFWDLRASVAFVQGRPEHKTDSSWPKSHWEIKPSSSSLPKETQLWCQCRYKETKQVCKGTVFCVTKVHQPVYTVCTEGEAISVVKNLKIK